MDTAVSLVEAYLRLNGYFTVTEFQVQHPIPEFKDPALSMLKLMEKLNIGLQFGASRETERPQERP